MKVATLLVIAALAAAQFVFVLAAVSNFSSLQLARARFDPEVLAMLSVIAGLAETAIGYQSAVIFGGRLSLGVGESLSKLMGSKYVVEVRKDDPIGLSGKFVRSSFLLYEPLLLFIITIAIPWDLYTLDSVHAGLFQPIIHSLDIFSRPLGTNAVLYSVQITPFVVFFSFLAGIVPSIALPYIRRLKVTGVNSGPFQVALLFYLVGGVAGLSVISTLLGLFYKVLVLDQLPSYYRYAFMLAVGLSLCYGVGSYFGLNRAERMVEEKLSRTSSQGIFEGSITVTPRPVKAASGNANQGGHKKASPGRLVAVVAVVIILLAAGVLVTRYSSIASLSTSSSQSTLSSGTGISGLTAGSLGYIGCSNTEDSVAGYHTIANRGYFWPPYSTGGFGITAWAKSGTTAWVLFNQMVGKYGQPKAVWVELCEQATSPVNFTSVKDELAVLRTFTTPSTVFYISPLNLYAKGILCPATGANGVNDTIGFANEAVAEGLAQRGPVLGPLTALLLQSDMCHPNQGGETLLGNQLTAFFG